MSNEERGEGGGHDHGEGDEGHNGGHGRRITIIVNARPKTVDHNELTFDEVVQLSGVPTGPDVTNTVVYRGAADQHHPDGTLVQGQKVKVKEGTIFDVSDTTRS